MGHSRSVGFQQGESNSLCLLAELSVAQQPWPIWAGWTRTNTTLTGINVGRGQWRQVAEEEVYLCRTVAVRHFLYCRRCGRRQHGGRAFGAADTTMSTVEGMLDRGMQLLRHTPHTFPSIVADRLQRKGGEGQTDCAGGLVKRP